MKEVGGRGLGFSVVGGADRSNPTGGFNVKRVYPEGLVAQDGTIQEGEAQTCPYRICFIFSRMNELIVGICFQAMHFWR